jgi:hypothetical protein
MPARPRWRSARLAQVVRTVHFQHVALQHGVVHVAGHLDAVVGEHVAVVLDVLSELGARGVFQPGLEARQHLLQRQLAWRVRALVRQRNVGRLARPHAEGDTDQARLPLVQRGGFGVQRGQLGGLDARQPALERGPVQDRLVRHLVRDGRGRCARRHVASRRRDSCSELGQRPESVFFVKLGQSRLCHLRRAAIESRAGRPST